VASAVSFVLWSIAAAMWWQDVELQTAANGGSHVLVVTKDGSSSWIPILWSPQGIAVSPAPRHRDRLVVRPDNAVQRAAMPVCLALLPTTEIDVPRRVVQQA